MLYGNVGPIDPPGPVPLRERLQSAIDYGEHLLAIRCDPRPWIEANLQIRSKDRRIIPLKLNPLQADYHAHATQWDVILKARQIGFTTLICARYFADSVLRPNTVSVIVAHDTDSSEKIFRIVQLFWERLPPAIQAMAGKPRFSNRREYSWPDINSQFYVGTAGALTFGRGQTINNLHCSEFAFWPKPEEALVALSEAVPADGRIVIESTANGVGNYFHDLWRAAMQRENRFAPHWYRWFDSAEYAIAPTAAEEVAWRAQLASGGSPGSGPAMMTDGVAPLDRDEIGLIRGHGLSFAQIKWRREKIRDLDGRFRTEYPENAVDCFEASTRGVFDPDALARAAARIAPAPAPQRMDMLRGKDTQVPVAPASLLVWEEPVAERVYVIGADVGEGVENGDASAACVLDRSSGAQVAELHGHVPPDRFAQMLNLLGRWYNGALLAVERNNHGHSTLNTLRNVCRYPRLYYHVRYDQTRQGTAMLGWPTDQATKPILVDDLAAAILEEALIMRSDGLVDECRTFVTHDGGSQGAQPGKHDDRVIAAGIAWQARKRMVARPIAKRPEGW